MKYQIGFLTVLCCKVFHSKDEIPASSSITKLLYSTLESFIGEIRNLEIPFHKDENIFNYTFHVTS